MADSIDIDALPNTAMFDSTVLVPALSQKLRSTDDPACGPLLEAMLENQKTVLVAAPSLAEIMRRSPSAPVPRTRLMYVVAFDQHAAEILGRTFSPKSLKRTRAATKLSLNCIKYDAMIVACALRHKADQFVTTDAAQRKFAMERGLVVHAPSDYLSRQPTLPHVK